MRGAFTGVGIGTPGRPVQYSTPVFGAVLGAVRGAGVSTICGGGVRTGSGAGGAATTGSGSGGGGGAASTSCTLGGAGGGAATTGSSSRSRSSFSWFLISSRFAICRLMSSMFAWISWLCFWSLASVRAC